MLRDSGWTWRIGGTRAAVVALLWGCGLGYSAQPGSLDTSFNPGLGVDQSVFAIALQADGKVVIGGDFSTVDDTPRQSIARLLSTGALDPSFATVPGPNDLVTAIALQDSKLIIGGYFTEVDGLTQHYLARLQTDGALDTNFLSGTAADDPVLSVAIQADQKVVLGGVFTRFNGASRTNIARLNSNGAVDPGFDPASGVSGETFSTVNVVAPQSDGQILLGGAFTQVQGAPRTNLARLSSLGVLDNGFSPAVGVAGAGLLAGVYTIAVQPDGRILIGGDFTSVTGMPRTNIARLTSQGIVDMTFNANPGLNGAVNSIALQSNGKIVLGGFFTQIGGTNRNYVARLNSDGALDHTFLAGAGADDAVYTTTVQPDGQVLIGGFFTSFDTTPRRGIARLHGDPVLVRPQLLNSAFNNGVFSVSVLTQPNRSYVLQFKNSLADSNWTSLPPVAGDGGIKLLTDPAAGPPSRLYRAVVN